MKVYGIDVTEDQIQAAERVIFSGKKFTALTVTFALERSGVKDGAPAYRAADRLLQKHRKAGVIAFKNGNWEMCK